MTFIYPNWTNVRGNIYPLTGDCFDGNFPMEKARSSLGIPAVIVSMDALPFWNAVSKGTATKEEIASRTAAVVDLAESSFSRVCNRESARFIATNKTGYILKVPTRTTGQAIGADCFNTWRNDWRALFASDIPEKFAKLHVASAQNVFIIIPPLAEPFQNAVARHLHVDASVISPTVGAIAPIVALHELAHARQYHYLDHDLTNEEKAQISFLKELDADIWARDIYMSGGGDMPACRHNWKTFEMVRLYAMQNADNNHFVGLQLEAMKAPGAPMVSVEAAQNARTRLRDSFTQFLEENSAVFTEWMSYGYSETDPLGLAITKRLVTSGRLDDDTQTIAEKIVAAGRFLLAPVCISLAEEKLIRLVSGNRRAPKWVNQQKNEPR